MPRPSKAKPKSEKLSCLFAVRTNPGDGKIIDRLRGKQSATEWFMGGRKKEIDAARKAGK